MTKKGKTSVKIAGCRTVVEKKQHTPSLPKILVIQSDDRKLEILTTFMKKNIDFCKKYELAYRNECDVMRHIPPYWRKVVLIEQAMSSQSIDVEWMIWIDSDAWLHDATMLKKVLRTHTDKIFIASSDPPVWNSPFNAGFFAVRNNTDGHRLMQAWNDLYDPSRWSFTQGKWHTPGDWAGRDYEQGAFNHDLLKSDEWHKHIYICPWYVFCETDWKKPHRSTAVIHLAGHYKTKYQ